MDVHTTVVVVSIFFFVFVGFFGNLSFIYTIASNDKIRSTLLLCILCVMHCVMLLHNFINVFRIMGGVRLTKEECVFAQTIPPTMYAVSHQAILYVVLGLDVMISLMNPARYIRIRSLPYVCILQLPCILYAASFIIASSFFDDDRKIAVCNPPEAFPRVVNNVRTQIGLAIGVIVLLIYMYIIYLLIRKSPTRTVKSSQIRAAKSMVALTATYLLSWFCTVTVSFLATRMPADSLFIRVYNQYAVLFALAAYSLTYYIHFLISREYRRAFLANFCCRPFVHHLNNLFSSRQGSELTPMGIPSSPGSRVQTQLVLS